MGWKPQKSPVVPVMEETIISIFFDMTDEKRENLFKVTRQLASVRDVNVTRRQIVIKYKSFFSGVEKTADLKKIEKTVREILHK